jgi:hypothetical protein
MYDTWGWHQQVSNWGAMHVRGHAAKYSRAGGLASKIYASMSSIIKLYQKRVRNIPFLYITLLNNKTYSVKVRWYWSCVVELIFKLFLCWTHLLAQPWPWIHKQIASTWKRLNYVNHSFRSLNVNNGMMSYYLTPLFRNLLSTASWSCCFFADCLKRHCFSDKLHVYQYGSSVQADLKD